MLLSRSKNIEYKNRIIVKSSILLSFIFDAGLTCKNPFNDDGKLNLDFVLKSSDLGHEGIKLFERAIPTWLNSLDKGKNPQNVASLEKALREIRNESSEI